MIDPKTSEAPTMFIAGNDRQAKEDVRSLLFECGWKDVVDCGGIAASRYLEAMTMVWITVAGQTGGTGHAFRLVRG